MQIYKGGDGVVVHMTNKEMTDLTEMLHSLSVATRIQLHSTESDLISKLLTAYNEAKK